MKIVGGERRRQLIVHAILILFAAVTLGPLLVLVFNSVKPSVELGQNPLGPPSSIHLSNFVDAWNRGAFSKAMPNSLILVGLTLAGLLPLAGMAAYALSRPRFPGGGILMLYLLVASTLPLQLFLVPLFFAWAKLGLISNLFGLAIIYIAVFAPFSIFLLRSYMIQIPRDFEDAARVDGASDLQIFRYVIAPLSGPGFLVAGLVATLAVWHEFLLATVFLTDGKTFTVVTSFSRFTSEFSTDWTLTSAGAIIAMAPIMILFLLLQRRFIAGLTRGGLAGY